MNKAPAARPELHNPTREARLRDKSLDEASAHPKHRCRDEKNLPADMAFELAIRPNASKEDVSQEFVNFVQDLDADEEYDSAVTALLCREAYEIGRKDGGRCSPGETVVTFLVVTITIVLLGAFLAAYG